MKKHYKELLSCADNKDELSYDHRLYDDLHKIPLYQNIPYMMPFIGSEYNKTKILLVCNTYYVPNYKEVGAQLNEEIDRWYSIAKGKKLRNGRLPTNGDKKKLDHFLTKGYSYGNRDDPTPAHSWINPRCHLDSRNSGWPWYKLAIAALQDEELINKVPALKGCKSYKNHDGEGKRYWRGKFYRYLALTNYHIRPTTEEEKPDFNQRDIEESKEIFLQALEVLEPKLICIVHKNLYCSIKEEVLQDINDRIKVHLIYCPTSSWFNRKPDMHGKKKFQRLMREHLFTTPKK